jgi:hypothetical protein
MAQQAISRKPNTRLCQLDVDAGSLESAAFSGTVAKNVINAQKLGVLCPTALTCSPIKFQDLHPPQSVLASAGFTEWLGVGLILPTPII